MYRHLGSKWKKQPVWGLTDKWEEELTQGDLGTLAVRRGSRAAFTGAHSTVVIQQRELHVHKRKKNKLGGFTTSTVTLFGFSNLI